MYGYLNRVRSSRRLEAECHRNMEVIWLLRTLKPDFKTIADFRSDNRAAFKSVFREFTVLCRRLDLFGRELLAIDGTRIKAVNNKDRNFTKASLDKFIAAADKKLDDYLARLDTDDEIEHAMAGARTRNLAEKIEALKRKRTQYAAYLKILERSGDDQVSMIDPDSPRHGRAYQSGRRLQCSDRGGCKEQDDRRTGGIKRCPGHGSFATNRRARASYT
ncbi:transposase [Bradyrhizobium sp. Pha-3]|uniref:transposase n=1 Tax=Bradyrhizobium sp. Pha-3 TaxID=208375 RepID=UPI0035D46304